MMKIGMTLMNKIKSIISVASISLLTALPASAHWSVTERVGKPTKDFTISRDEVVDNLESNKLYALVEYGVIAKVFIWSENNSRDYITAYTPGSLLPLDMIEELVFVAKMPESLAVNFTNEDGSAGVEPINHGDAITVVEVLDQPDSPSTVPTYVNPTEVISSSTNVDYSTTLVLKPIENTDPNKTVEVQVISQGLSYTSITTDNSSNPITINNLPSDTLVTVQQVVRDVQTNQETVLQNILTRTPDAQIPVIENARDVESDKEEITAPTTVVTVNPDNGSRSAVITFQPIANFDPTRTLASIIVVGPGGSTTSVGIDGAGGSVNIHDLALDSRYKVTMVIRDLGSGEETIIRGANL
jgi:hypothetical protein